MGYPLSCRHFGRARRVDIASSMAHGRREWKETVIPTTVAGKTKAKSSLADNAGGSVCDACTVYRLSSFAEAELSTAERTTRERPN